MCRRMAVQVTRLVINPAFYHQSAAALKINKRTEDELRKRSPSIFDDVFPVFSAQSRGFFFFQAFCSPRVLIRLPIPPLKSQVLHIPLLKNLLQLIRIKRCSYGLPNLEQQARTRCMRQMITLIRWARTMSFIFKTFHMRAAEGSICW